MTDRNQCDGCAQGLPINDGIHYREGKPWIGCTASRYAPTDPRALLKASIHVSGLSTADYARQRLTRAPATVYNWLAGDFPIPERVQRWLETQPEYPQALELIAHPATEEIAP